MRTPLCLRGEMPVIVGTTRSGSCDEDLCSCDSPSIFHACSASVLPGRVSVCASVSAVHASLAGTKPDLPWKSTRHVERHPRGRMEEVPTCLIDVRCPARLGVLSDGSIPAPPLGTIRNGPSATAREMLHRSSRLGRAWRRWVLSPGFLASSTLPQAQVLRLSQRSATVLLYRLSLV